MSVKWVERAVIVAYVVTIVPFLMLGYAQVTQYHPVYRAISYQPAGWSFR